MIGPIRILLADDHPVTRAGTRLVLKGEADLEAIGEAADGNAAVQLARVLRPDVVLLGLNLPGLLGVGVARILRTDAPEMRIVVVTGYAVEPYTAALEQLGVEAVLSKTAPTGDLVRAVRAAGASRRPRAVDTPQPPECAGRGAATSRELTVVRLVEAGLSNKGIARRLAIKERTVEFHLDNLFRKLGAASRTEAIHLARQRGWLT